MPWFRLYLKRCGFILGLALVLLIVFVSTVDLGLSLNGSIALVLGSLLTVALTLLLMGLLFLSNRNGQDRDAHQALPEEFRDPSNR